jgi:hypothetical protein
MRNASKITASGLASRYTQGDTILLDGFDTYSIGRRGSGINVMYIKATVQPHGERYCEFDVVYPLKADVKSRALVQAAADARATQLKSMLQGKGISVADFVTRDMRYV